MKLPDVTRALGVKGYSDSEVNLIYETMAVFRPDFIAEWGTNQGNSARIFYEAREMLELPCVIHSTEIQQDLGDAWEHERGYHVLDTDVCLHVGDGLTESITLWHASGAHRPLFFLDDNHAESEVLKQLRTIHDEAYGAVILIHDTHTLTDMGLEFHEPGKAVAVFLDETKDVYAYTEVLTGQCMVRLWPK